MATGLFVVTAVAAAAIAIDERAFFVHVPAAAAAAATSAIVIELVFLTATIISIAATTTTTTTTTAAAAATTTTTTSFALGYFHRQDPVLYFNQDLWNSLKYEVVGTEVECVPDAHQISKIQSSSSYWSSSSSSSSSPTTPFDYKILVPPLNIFQHLRYLGVYMGPRVVMIKTVASTTATWLRQLHSFWNKIKK
mmetsp:Transcript_13038/g.15470  ORF Transcript_13038/g.15470 Transcript_13038/m.15470 type:complete len:194 (-) Transcript_13038:127-708(-)